MRARIEATPGVAMIVRDLVGSTSRIESFSCHHVFSLLQRAHCLLLPQIGNGADGISDIEGKVARVATSKLGNERVSITNPRSHPWKMFAVWPACNGADGISDLEGKVTRVGSECGQRASSNGIEICRTNRTKSMNQRSHCQRLRQLLHLRREISCHD